jgi:hypothetical protein
LSSTNQFPIVKIGLHRGEKPMKADRSFTKAIDNLHNPWYNEIIITWIFHKNSRRGGTEHADVGG